MNKGLSLVEILVTVGIFALLGVLTTRAVALTLKGGRKSESQLRVRENLNYALGVIERQLRNASSITGCTATRVDYLDAARLASFFACVNTGGDAYVASGSARLTSSEVKITYCSISCSNTEPPTVDIFLTAASVQSQGGEGASVTAATKIHLRTY